MYFYDIGCRKRRKNAQDFVWKVHRVGSIYTLAHEIIIHTHTQHTNKIVKGGPKRCKAAGRMESEGGGCTIAENIAHQTTVCENIAKSYFISCNNVLNIRILMLTSWNI